MDGPIIAVVASGITVVGGAIRSLRLSPGSTAYSRYLRNIFNLPIAI